MPRILREGEWYDPVAPTSIYESDFQAMVVAQAQHIFPDYAVIRFDKIVASEHGAAKADLALVDRHYRFWWVVEIELSTHSLEGHVRPQVQTLSSAEYGADEAGYISDRSPGLDAAKVQQMMKGNQPRVLVVVNAPMPYWQISLSHLGAIVAVVEVYRSDKNRLVFRLDGDYPALPHNFVSHCHLDSALPKLMVVESPGGLPQTMDSRLTIRFEGGVTRWLKVESRDTVWLIPDGPLGLQPRARYILRQGEDGELDLVKEQ
jgi:hypothetical protein